MQKLQHFWKIIILIFHWNDQSKSSNGTLLTCVRSYIYIVVMTQNSPIHLNSMIFYSVVFQQGIDP